MRRPAVGQGIRMQKITVLSGGMGGARFLQGLLHGIDEGTLPGVDRDGGWGRREETWHVKEELAAYGVEPTWFGLGDRDVATHLVRTQMLEAGYPLSQVTAALCQRWLAPLGGRLTLLPMTDDRVETHVAIADADAPSGRRVVHFQEYWVRLRAAVPAELLVFVGLEESSPGP